MGDAPRDGRASLLRSGHDHHRLDRGHRRGLCHQLPDSNKVEGGGGHIRPELVAPLVPELAATADRF